MLMKLPAVMQSKLLLRLASNFVSGNEFAQRDGSDPGVIRKNDALALFTRSQMQQKIPRKSKTVP